MGIYVTAAELRAEPDVPDDLPDAEANAAIDAAEDRIDDWLGAWPVQTEGASAGRKIVEADVAAWQWAKLKRATVRLAARLNANPDALEPDRYESISGPDFSKSGPRSPGSRIGEVSSPLNASGLRLFGARAVP